MIVGIPTVTFVALIIQPVIIVLSILYAVNYDKLIKKAPFNFYARLEDEFKEKK